MVEENASGSEVTRAVVQRARDRKKVCSPTAWANPEILYTDDDYPDWKLVRLTHPQDIALLGQAMRHCAAAHVKWVTDEQIWHFLTVLDSKGIPHTTIHAKQKAWYNEPHPDDATAMWFGTKLPDMEREDGGATQWVKSTTYDCPWVPESFEGDVLINGEPCLLLSLEGVGGADTSKYNNFIQRWFNANRIEEAVSA